MRVTLQVELDTIQANLVEEGELVLRALRGAMERSGSAIQSSPTR